MSANESGTAGPPPEESSPPPFGAAHVALLTSRLEDLARQAQERKSERESASAQAGPSAAPAPPPAPMLPPLPAPPRAQPAAANSSHPEDVLARRRRETEERMASVDESARWAGTHLDQKDTRGQAPVDHGRVAALVSEMLAKPNVPRYISADDLDENFMRNHWSRLTESRDFSGVADRERAFAEVVFKKLTNAEFVSQLLGIELAEGGRELPLEPYAAAEHIVGLAEHLAAFVNRNLPGSPVRIAGSTAAMKADPERLVADDIDLDYYDKHADDEEAEARWEAAVKALGNAPVYRSKLGPTYRSGVSVEGTRRELAKCVWTVKAEISGVPFIMSVPVEMKNVSGAAWHEGMKEGRRREVGEGTWLPDAQVYVDVCSRYVDLILQALAAADLPTGEEKRRAVERAAKEKSLFVKMINLEEQLGPEGVEGARQLARRKLTSERYDIWMKVSNRQLASVFE